MKKMKCLPDVWREVESIAEAFESHAPKFDTVSENTLTVLRDRLNNCAESVQTIRDKIVWE